MNYSKNKDLGFKKEAILILPIPVSESPGAQNYISKMKTLRDELRNVPGVQSTSLSSAPPSSGNVSNTIFSIDGIDETFVTQIKQVDGNYIDLYGLQVIAGKGVEDFDTARGFVVNEKFVRTIGSTEDKLLGKVIDIWGKKLPIVGVVKDFHTVSLRAPIEATILMNQLRGYETLSVSVDVSRIQDVINVIKPRWEATYPEHIFDYRFLDQQIEEFYEGEKRMSVMLSAFSGIAIFIGCLGLYGLATFMANQKTKEVGVRKVLGASVESIIFLFSREYVKLILLGFLFSTPIAWFMMNKFLEEFSYKEEIGPSVFLTGLGITVFIALITVGYKSIQAAVANPAQSLKSE
jgi:ABC-type antimicrobial peptide transport system permease subunit